MYEMFSDQAGIDFVKRNGSERITTKRLSSCHLMNVSFTERWLSARAVPQLGRSHDPR